MESKDSSKLAQLLGLDTTAQSGQTPRQSLQAFFTTFKTKLVEKESMKILNMVLGLMMSTEILDQKKRGLQWDKNFKPKSNTSQALETMILKELTLRSDNLAHLKQFLMQVSQRTNPCNSRLVQDLTKLVK